MGFPNHGMARVAARLRRMRASGAGQETRSILGVSIGKQKETPLADAVQDYLVVMRAVYAQADYLAVNVSSPNTPGLRALQGRSYLEDLLGQLQEENRRLAQDEGKRPLLLKMAPDLTWDEIDVVLEAASRCGVDGLIATNTTVARPGLDARWRLESGGLSGAPLAQHSLAIVSHVCEIMGDRLPVVAVGGVMSVDDVQARLDAGARLVQVYTGLVYNGPQMAGCILRQMERTRT
jgi:dihydroorotate dehydrogenase